MNLDAIKLATLAAIRELTMVVEFAEQANDAIEASVFQPGADIELDSAEGALATATLKLEDLGDLLTEAKRAALATTTATK